MPALFRRRKVTCFYCNQPSVPGEGASYHPNGRVSLFVCPHCNADNHLDQNGEIADYVPETPPKPLLFAHRRQSNRARPTTLDSIEPSTSSSSTPTFCTQCQHNQLILQNAKANYDMPPEDHPDYDHHANVLYPRYIKDLESRYPPMCSECIPRVKQRLKQVNYNAKVASLGKMLARSSERPLTVARELGPVRTLRWCFWMLRGAVWLWANILFLVWHVSGIFYPSGSSDGFGDPGWFRCLFSSLSKSELDGTCYDASFRQISNHFLWTLLGFWWLYRQWDVEQHPEMRLLGGREYLHIEIAVLVLRIASWILLAEGGMLLDASEETRRQMHALFFFASFVAFLFSITCLKLEEPPTFSLRETCPPSPEKSRTSTPAAASTYAPVRAPQSAVASKQRSTPLQQPAHTLSLNKTPPLRPINPNQTVPPLSPITPSYRDSTASIVLSPSPTPRHHQDYDMMDLDSIEPARGTSPWALRDPSESPTRALTSRLAASTRLSLNSPSSSLSIFGQTQAPTSIFSRPSVAPEPEPTKRGPPPLAEARFTRIPDPDDTGLEGMLSGGLKLVDEPEIIATEGVGREKETLLTVLARLGLLVIAAGGISMLVPEAAKIVALPIVVAAALWRMVRADNVVRVFSALEIGAVLLVGTLSALEVVQEKTLGNVGAALVAWAAAAEVWRLLMRAQRERKRTFWREERLKAVREEVRRGNSTSPKTETDQWGFRRPGSPTPVLLPGLGGVRKKRMGTATAAAAGFGNMRSGGMFA